MTTRSIAPQSLKESEDEEPAEGVPSSAGSCVPAIGYPYGAPVRWQGGRKARMNETPHSRFCSAADALGQQ